MIHNSAFESFTFWLDVFAGLCLQCTFLVALKYKMSMLGREEDRTYTSLGTLSTMGEDCKKSHGNTLS